MLSPKIKRLAVFLILLEIFLLNTSSTDADIFAERIVKENKFSAISLDFSVGNSFNGGALPTLFKTLGILPEGYDLGAARIVSPGRSGTKYALRAISNSGDANLCDQLDLKVLNRNFSLLFDGKLMGLDLKSQFPKSNADDYIFFASLNENGDELKNKICDFSFSLRTFRQDPGETGGIFAERRISNFISSGNW
jgi:hypothetical protein